MQSIPIEIILIGSEDFDFQIAELENTLYVEHPNEPSLGAKWQAGVNVARYLGANFLMIAGSDDWQSKDWAALLIGMMGKDFDVGGSRIGYFLNCKKGHIWELYEVEAYKGTDRHGEILGPGRIFSKTYLDKIDWQLFPSDPQFNAGLDGASIARIPKERRLDFSYDAESLSLKGDWTQINNFDEVMSSSNGKVQILNPEQWVDEHFEGGMDSIKGLMA
jgi:hypothetical protein